MNTSTTRRVLAAAAAAVLATVTVGAAPASAGVSSTGELGVALFYSNDEYALFTGPAWEVGCLKEFPTATTHIVETPSGISSERGTLENLALLYDLEAEGVSSGFELLLKACAAVEAGEPTPVPVAEGTTTDVYHLAERPARRYEKHFSVGTLETPDGQRLKVHGHFRATFTTAEDGSEEVAVFETLVVNPVG